MSTFARLCRSATLFCSAALPLAAAAQQTRRVPQDFPTIQSAINASATGDTVLVAPGTYFETLTLDTKEITLTSSAGPGRTVLDGQQQHTILSITNTPGMQTVISGFTFQNGNSFGAAQTYGPAGIFLSQAGATIRGNSFSRNIGYNIYALNSSANVTGNALSTAGLPASPCLFNGGISAFASTGISISGTSAIPPSLTLPPGIFGNTIVGDGTSCSGDAVQVLAAGPAALPIQGNTLRNSYRAVTATSPVLISQNLIYGNVIGGLNLYTPSAPPNVDPATTLVINNTLVNNVTTSDPGSSVRSDVLLSGTVARTALINNILVGTSGHTVLRCETVASPSINDTPLIFDHNDLYNPANASDGLVAGDCFPDLTAPLSSNGNLSLDLRFTSTSNFRPIFGSPVIDAGNDSAPGIIARGTDPSTVDFDGNPRLVGSTGIGYANVDLGVYEQQLGYNSFNSSATTLVASAYETSLGSVTLTASVIASSLYSGNTRPGGRITFYQNGQSLGQVDLPFQGEASLSVPLPAAGLFGFTASFFPPESFGPSISPVLYVRATNPTAPATTLTLTTPATQTLNQPLTLTIHLGSTTGSGSTTTPGPVPPGAVTLFEGNTILSSLQPDTTGLATYTIPRPGLGSHTYTVTYAGTTLFPAATAATSVSITAPVATTLTASATPNPAPFNAPVTCTATVVAASGPAPTGTVVFTDGATPQGSVRLSSPGEQGIATVVLYNLTVGLHTLTVTFQPDPGFSPSTGTCTVNVGGNTTRTTLVSSKNPAGTADTIVYVATVANTGTAGAPPPTGSVSLSEGNTLLATAPLVPDALGSSYAELLANLNPPGLHILTATYLPATPATFTSSATLTETVTAPPPIATTVSASPNPVTFGQLTTLSAVVTSVAPIPTPATVTFTDGATVLGTVPLPTAGPATLSLSTLSVGSHSIGAILHTSDTTAIRSSATPITLQVHGLPDTLTLSVSPSPTAFATLPVTLTAVLTPTSAVPSGTTLSGAITFLDGNLPLGTATLSADGRATFTTATLTPGLHTLTVSYSGNALLASAISAPFPEQIATNPTTTSLSVTPAATTAFAPVILAAHVVSATSAARVNTLVCPPTCTPITITFVATSAAGPAILGIVPVDATGNATLSLNPIAGASSISATFSGSPLFDPSSSAVSPLTISAAPSALTLTANPNPVYQHGAVTLIAALTAPGVPPSALDGTITFLEGTTALGTTTLPAARAFAYPPASVGTHTLTAIFSGSSNLLGASATVTVTVLPSDFALSLKDTTLTLATTHHRPTTVSIQTTGALADQVDLSCTNLPQFATCTFSPATHDLTATNASTGTLTLDTDALLNYARIQSPVTPFHRLLWQTGPFLAFCLPLGLLATLKRRPRSALGKLHRRLPNLLTLFLLSLSALTLAGCSGLYPGHTAPGTYTITITGHARTSAIEHSTQLTLVVMP